MLAAVLQKSGISLFDRDVFVNAAGGVRVLEPAADLGIVSAIISAFTEIPLPADTIFLGELGLVGEVRAVSHPQLRLREAARQGFRFAVAPPSNITSAPPGIEVIPMRRISDLIQLLSR